MVDTFLPGAQGMGMVWKSTYDQQGSSMSWNGSFWSMLRCMRHERAFLQLRHRSGLPRTGRQASTCELPSFSGVKDKAISYQRHKRIMTIHRLFGQHHCSRDLRSLGRLSFVCET